ncbi:MAG: hypothetical protein HZA52_20860 [Planctomycetes bacterium]|nr:hypothetical protein [Planctomycetota bacterium]
MTRNRHSLRSLGVAFAVPLALALVWLIRTRGEPVASVSRPEASSEPGASSHTGPPPVATEATTSAGGRSAVVDSQDPAVATAVSKRERQWFVRGRVVGAPPGSEQEAKLGAHFLGRYNIEDRVEGFATADGSFELDVTAPVEAWLRHVPPSELVVSVDHPACLREEARVPFTSGAVSTSAPELERTEFRCELVLTSAALVTGSVAVPSDWALPREREAVDGARVALFELVDGQPRGDRPVDSGKCDGAGRWTLRAPTSGPFVVVAHAGGLQPSARTVELVLGRPLDVGTLTLSRAAWISGVVRRMGRPVDAGTTVSARLTEVRGPDLLIASPGWPSLRLQWLGDELRRIDASVTTDAAGRYRLEGLAEADYDVWVSSAPNLRLHAGGRVVPERRVRAPADGVDLDGAPGLLELRMVVDGRAPNRDDLEGVQAEFVPTDSERRVITFELTSNDGNYGRIQLEGGLGYTLRVLPGRFAATEVAVAPFSPGEERVLTLELRRADLESTLLLIPILEPSEPVDSLDLLVCDGADANVQRELWTRSERSTDGKFRCEPLPPGRYAVRVRAGPTLANGASSHYVEQWLDVELPAGATVEREVELTLGGRVRMSAQDEHGAFVRAAVELRDAGGEKLGTEFYCNVQGMSYGCGWYLCEQGLNDHPPLPAGRYEFTLSAEGYESEVRAVELVAGETRTLEVVLRRR